ncbi:MAG: hypothetical protein KBC57_01745 [Neisseriaceae bacterium]|nr:hypothetical protein [Neisseriaceae bacterium]MBP6861064.1 hypothetical protein [Neisseriaceae bacterium]
MSNLHNHYSGLASVLANPEAVANPKALSAGDLSLMQSHVQAAHFGLGQVLSAVAVLIQSQARVDPAYQMPQPELNDAMAELLLLAGGVMMTLSDIGQAFNDEEYRRIRPY